MHRLFILFFLVFSVFSYSFAQHETKKDSTIVLKNDDYSNFRRSNKVSPHSATIDFDTSGQAVKPKLIAFDYEKMTNQADLKYKKREYRKAIDLYTTAFAKNNDLGLVKHRYNLACCYVHINSLDSAFLQLFRIAERGKYFNYSEIESESCFKSLHTDSRWTKLITTIKENAKKLEDEMNSNTPNN